MNKRTITFIIVCTIVAYLLILFLELSIIWIHVITILSFIIAIASLHVPSSYEYEFSTESWEDCGDQLRIIIPSKIHKLGSKVTCTLYELDRNCNYEMVMATIIIDKGDVIIYIGKGIPFTGKAVIQS